MAESVSIKAKHSFGVASARHTSGIVVKDSKFLFDAPLGPSVVRWDLEKEERCRQFQAHSDLIVCMQLSPDNKYIATCSSGGEVKLWNTKWSLVSQTIASVQSLFHLAWSHNSDSFLVVSNGLQSSSMLYVIEKEKNLKCLWQVQAGQFPKRDPSVKSHDDQQQSCDHQHQSHDDKQQSHDKKQQSHDHQHQSRDEIQQSHDQSHDHQHQSHDVERTGADYHQGDIFYMGEINPSGNCLLVEEREKACTMVHLYSSSGNLLKSITVSSLDGRKEVHTHMISSFNNGCYVIMAQGGFVLVIKGEELEIISIFNMGYTSRCCVWDNNLIILPSDNGKLTWVNIDTGSKVYEFSVVSSDFIVHIDWSVDKDALWVCGFSRLSYCAVTRNEKGDVVKVSTTFRISTHEISCCGVDFSLDSSKLAVGDLAGNVYLYDCNIDLCHPLEMWNVGASVRCITWLDDNCLLIGCLDGLSHKWIIGEGIKIYFAMEGSIIHMRVSNNRKYLAVGTSLGKVGIFSLDDVSMGGAHSNIVCPVSVFIAHKSQPDREDTRFGQLGKQAEVWSLSWSPDDKHLATCSEDQTVRIWEAGSWVGVATLTGHVLAVTSVDWRIINGRSLLASCSDDRTIRVYDSENNYDIINIMNTKNIYGWHTLTYLAFYPHNKKEGCSYLMVTTQHGYLVLFDVFSGKMLLQNKMHCGSVEGLVWEGKKKQLATVGGDCAAYIWDTGL